MDKLHFFVNNHAFFDTRIKNLLTTDDSYMYNGTACLLWSEWLNDDGYGIYHYKQKRYSLHRIMYAIFKGELTPGLVIDHLCRNRNCCNPDHLEEVTYKVNSQRGDTGKHMAIREGSKTHCPKGHEYTEENTKIQKVKKSDGTFREKRQCRQCSKIYQEKFRNSDNLCFEVVVKPDQKTHCIRGHEYTPDNTKYYPSPNGCASRRQCMTCARERKKLSSQKY